MLRRKHSHAKLVVVSIRTNHFRQEDSQYAGWEVYPLIHPSSDSATITAAALAGLRRVYRPCCSYKKAGEVLLEIGPADCVQPDLFAHTPDLRRDRVMAVMAHINREYGRGTLCRVSEKLHSGWAMLEE